MDNHSYPCDRGIADGLLRPSLCSGQLGYERDTQREYLLADHPLTAGFLAVANAWGFILGFVLWVKGNLAPSLRGDQKLTGTLLLCILAKKQKTERTLRLLAVRLHLWGMYVLYLDHGHLD